MNVIEATRELGKAIQQDEVFKNFITARERNDNDKELQDKIAKLNAVRTTYMQESAKEDKNDKTLEALSKEFNDVYAEIMDNKNMQAYMAANAEMEKMMKEISGILALCADGEDPETCEVQDSGCEGDCCSCGGCH